MDRNARSHRHQHRKRIERRARSVEAMEFFNVLSSQEMLETVDGLSPPHRGRLYPQPDTQAEGVGFPLARVVVVICLATGAVLDAAIGAHSCKGTGESSLWRGLVEVFEPGDVMLADALYCNYFLIATLARAGVDVLFEQNGSRITDFRRDSR